LTGASAELSKKAASKKCVGGGVRLALNPATPATTTVTQLIFDGFFDPEIYGNLEKILLDYLEPTFLSYFR
jgi:hypothetical protein